MNLKPKPSPKAYRATTSFAGPAGLKVKRGDLFRADHPLVRWATEVGSLSNLFAETQVPDTDPLPSDKPTEEERRAFRALTDPPKPVPAPKPRPRMIATRTFFTGGTGVVTEGTVVDPSHWLVKHFGQYFRKAEIEA